MIKIVFWLCDLTASLREFPLRSLQATSQLRRARLRIQRAGRKRGGFSMSYAMVLSLITVAFLVGMGVYLYFLVKKKLS